VRRLAGPELIAERDAGRSSIERVAPSGAAAQHVSTRRNWPTGRGFERWYGFLGAETNQWYPDLVYDNHMVDQPRSPAGGYHLTDDLTDKALEFIQDAQAFAQRSRSPSTFSTLEFECLRNNYDAIVEWGHSRSRRVAAPDRHPEPDTRDPRRGDLMIPPKGSHLMAALIPDAQIRVYPDAAHGFLSQHPIEVAADVNAFLADDDREGRS
jgi:pimeloyl-ACP methyl ester carboxylesterase